MTNHNVNIGLRGEYRLVAKKAGEVVRDTGWFQNMILDNGLDMIGNQQTGPLKVCAIGENNTAVNASQTALFAYHQHKDGSTSEVAVNSGSPQYISQVTYKYLFPVQAVSKNYAEVGVGPSYSNLFSRALIVDVGGTPTTFSILAGEQLEVTYRLWVYPQLVDSVNVVNISGTNYTFTTRCGFAASTNPGWKTLSTWQIALWNPRAVPTNGTIGSVTGTVSGTSGTAVNASAAAYTNGNFYRDVTYSWSTAQGNLSGGISALTHEVMPGGGGTLFYFQSGISPALAKDNTKTLSLTFRFSWSRL